MHIFFNSQFLWLLLPTVVTILGGLLTLWWHPHQKTISLVQHFAAGIVLAVVSVEIIPHITQKHIPTLDIVIAFALGSVFMYVLKIATDHLAKNKNSTASIWNGLFIATLIDVSFDGLMIGVGFASGANTGILLALGLSVELLFLGLSLINEHVKGKKLVFMTVILGIAVFTTAAIGSSLLGHASNVTIATILSFSAAALLYLVTEELLIEAHHVEESHFATLVFFSGFLLFWTMALIGGD